MHDQIGSLVSLLRFFRHHLFSAWNILWWFLLHAPAIYRFRLCNFSFEVQFCMSISVSKINFQSVYCVRFPKNTSGLGRGSLERLKAEAIKFAKVLPLVASVLIFKNPVLLNDFCTFIVHQLLHSVHTLPFFDFLDAEIALHLATGIGGERRGVWYISRLLLSTWSSRSIAFMYTCCFFCSIWNLAWAFIWAISRRFCSISLCCFLSSAQILSSSALVWICVWMLISFATELACIFFHFSHNAEELINLWKILEPIVEEYELYPDLDSAERSLRFSFNSFAPDMSYLA